MASIAQLVSELSHSLGQPNNRALRENLKLLIIHTRNELIRHSYENHGYVDKGLTQRYKVSLIDVPDGDPNLDGLDIDTSDIETIKRTQQKVPRPVRLTNNLPFDRVSTVGYKTNREIPFIKEAAARFTSSLPGMCAMPRYDYINGFIYIFPADNYPFEQGAIVIESAFEHPNVIEANNGETDKWDIAMDENEWLLPEDMIGQITEIIYKRNLVQTHRETDEIQNNIKFN